MSHALSKIDVDRRAKQLNPISSQYYRDQAHAHHKAAELVALAQRRLQNEAIHLKRTQKRAGD